MENFKSGNFKFQWNVLVIYFRFEMFGIMADIFPLAAFSFLAFVICVFSRCIF